jgi:hypothetical protein
VTINSSTLVDGTNDGLASNYSLATGQTVAAAITAKALTATAVAANKVYDGNATATSTLTLSGLIGTETLTTSGVGSTFNDKDVADATTVTVTASTLLDGTNGGLASNYSLATGQTVAAAITAKALTVIVDDNHSMTQGGSVPNLTYAIAGASLVNDDTLTGALTTVATSSSSAGTYGITQGTLTNEQNPNYSITFGADNLIILPTVVRAPVMVATLLPRSEAFNAPSSSSEEGEQEDDEEDDSSAFK